MPLQDVKKVADADFPTRWGHFRILGFEGTRIDPEPCSPGTAAVHKKTEGAVAVPAALLFACIRRREPATKTAACLGLILLISLLGASDVWRGRRGWRARLAVSDYLVDHTTREDAARSAGEWIEDSVIGS